MAPQSSFVRAIPSSGDRSIKLLTRCQLLPRQFKFFNPGNARTGEISVRLSDTNPSSVTTPFTIFGVPIPSAPVTLPSKPGFSSISFLATASTCFSAGKAATSFIHCWKAGSLNVVILLSCRSNVALIDAFRPNPSRNLWQRT